MDIAQIKQLTTVDGWVDFSGQITKVGEIKSRVKSELSKTPGQQYNVQKLQVQDRTDVIGIWAYADKQFLPSQRVTVRGMLKEFNQVRYIDFATVKVDGQQPQTPQLSPQQAPRPPQQANSKKDVDWDAKDLRMARECALKNATQLICTLAELKNGDMGLDAVTIKGIAEIFVDYIYNGNTPDPHPDITEDTNTYEEAKAVHESQARTGDDDLPF